MEPDLAGFYITDRFIDIMLGRDKTSGLKTKIGNDFQVIYDTHKWVIREHFKDGVSPAETFQSAVEKIADRTRSIRSVAVGCYGPFVSVDPRDRGAPKYGKLRETTHGILTGRSIYDLTRDAFQKKLAIAPLVTVEPDVVVAAIGEFYHRYTDDGILKKRDDSTVLAFVKVSHGVGGAIVVGGNPFKGHLHSEMGHCYVKRWEHRFLDPENAEKTFRRNEPYANRLETLASAGAFKARWGSEYHEIAKEIDEHPAWERQSWYIAQFCINITMFMVPKTIILGGSLMTVDGLIDKVRSHFKKMLGMPPIPDYPDVRRKLYLDLPSGSLTNEPGRPGALGALCVAAKMARPQRSGD